MDKTYVEMCKTDIIQKHWKKEPGDWYYCPQQTVLIESETDSIPEGVYIISDSYGPHAFYVVAECVWLPTLKQIQDMLVPFELPENTESLGKPCHNIAFAVGQWVLKKWGIAIRYKTMEQLWLGFMMYHKHGLIWEDGEWVKEEKPELEEIDAKHLVWVNNKDAK